LSLDALAVGVLSFYASHAKQMYPYSKKEKNPNSPGKKKKKSLYIARAGRLSQRILLFFIL